VRSSGTSHAVEHRSGASATPFAAVAQDPPAPSGHRPVRERHALEVLEAMERGDRVLHMLVVLLPRDRTGTNVALPSALALHVRAAIRMRRENVLDLVKPDEREFTV
jgi:hypothetical protein